MINDMNNTSLFSEYYKQWVDVYKKGAIRDATLSKYLMTLKWIEKLAPELKVADMTRTAYQQLLNDYAQEHERQTTLDFHHQLKGAILDALDEGPDVITSVFSFHKTDIRFESPDYISSFSCQVVASYDQIPFNACNVLHFAYEIGNLVVVV